jgi:hypothetical protein
MPEILTKHPDVVMNILKQNGIACRAGGTPRILTKCPAEGFCKPQGGEFCVYGLDQIHLMTQIRPEELCSRNRDKQMLSHSVSFMLGCFMSYLLYKRRR